MVGLLSFSGTSGETPGPSLALFNNPYYSITNNVYVSTTGNDTTGTGTIGNPWATISKANASVPTAGTCINVAPGTYANGATITNGGSSASAGGYVIYRSTVLGGAIITDPGNHNNACFSIKANYVIIDGFTMAASTQQTFGQAVEVFTTGSAFTLSQHHVWVLNCTISGYGQAGLQMNEGEYFYAIHNRIFNCCQALNEDSGAQGSGISFANEIPIASYSRTADDQNNSVTGNTETLFNNFIMWNDIYNNWINDSGNTNGNSDGNGIILDTFNWAGTGGAVAYTNGTLVAFNAVYNNGGGGVHVFRSEYVTVANNSVYNNYLDTHNTGTARGSIDDNLSYGNTIVNNISYAIGGAGILASNSAVGAFGTGSTITTTLNGSITSGSGSIVLTSATNFPAGATGQLFNNSYALPGGNMVKVDSEIMLVTGGWGTTTLTVQRGYYGTTAASHTNGATITWVQTYWANNVTVATGSGATDVNGPFSGEQYSITQNKTASDPLWVDVGKTSPGSISTKPTGNNFALTASSPAIGYGQTFSWLSPKSVDAGCASSTLLSSP